MSRRYKCEDCGREFETESRGVLPKRCSTCKEERAKFLKKRWSRRLRSAIAKMNRTIKCASCGKEFSPKAGNSQRAHPELCTECARKEASKIVSARSCDDGFGLVSNKDIQNARTKPEGVSDARWRIELERRRNPELYEGIGGVVK